ncbi:thioesterase, FlK family [Corynebacterium gerontici]|uniref:thioesterase, FlK family n=1 Tax=Corynebacterium gerontici TaxID=2079234 RepID=UPI003CCC7D42
MAESDLATQWRNDIPVVATPILIWLCELAAMRELENEGCDAFTVGFSHECKHVGACGLGEVVEVEARLVSQSESDYVFDCIARHGTKTLLSSKHIRKAVQRDRDDEDFS